MRNKTHTLVRSQKPTSWGSGCSHPPIFGPDCACLRPDASTCLHHGQLQSMSFSVNILTHGADLRHALRSNSNKGCLIPLHIAMALMFFCSARVRTLPYIIL
ncbi:hypothetical protein FVEG_14667 [Fusarium verticillioides 7600]|uniref:Uncharacterized protein n=1 Tax=Gibberella moniliformis (strain M3125 / FGSC 7600) TaxID=334819 RepID=W7LLZ2_GIBM7|nr:hypothetical protein FVEG_14667 [Fusarium verticillioides 7600]XP_018742616.1 hypothetical protein FVEG_14667 [Fusarium verticillioides 7600]EWG36424.1 hypothetical protein FVEG_14667 [Fusarium verticillioides 7600]EWG36425.1 hypothetical protein FVEG_14667 [Fusarium verticillioides 7600]